LSLVSYLHFLSKDGVGVYIVMCFLALQTTGMQSASLLVYKIITCWCWMQARSSLVHLLTHSLKDMLRLYVCFTKYYCVWFSHYF